MFFNTVWILFNKLRKKFPNLKHNCSFLDWILKKKENKTQNDRTKWCWRYTSSPVDIAKFEQYRIYGKYLSPSNHVQQQQHLFFLRFSKIDWYWTFLFIIWQQNDDEAERAHRRRTFGKSTTTTLSNDSLVEEQQGLQNCLKIFQDNVSNKFTPFIWFVYVFSLCLKLILEIYLENLFEKCVVINVNR